MQMGIYRRIWGAVDGGIGFKKTTDVAISPALLKVFTVLPG